MRNIPTFALQIAELESSIRFIQFLSLRIVRFHVNGSIILFVIAMAAYKNVLSVTVLLTYSLLWKKPLS